MADNTINQVLQPALLDRLIDDFRISTIFELRTSSDRLEAVGVQLDTLLRAASALGLTPLEDPQVDGPAIVLRHSAPGRSVSLADFRELPVRSATRGELLVQSFADVRATTVANMAIDPADSRGLSMRRLRESVLRDLAWLLNAMSLDDAEALDNLPWVASSVLNYGLPCLAGKTRSSLDPQAVAQLVRVAIENFEPRLRGVRVAPSTQDVAGDSGSLDFRIEAELWGYPVSQRVLMQTRIDLNSGNVAVDDVGGG